MKASQKASMKQGFTLIELIIVIAILAFVSVIGIHSYGNIKEIQAKKVNLANIKRIYHSLMTYEELCKEQTTTEYFKGFDSLIDVKASGAWYGTEGVCKFGTWGSVGKDGTTYSGTTCDAREADGGFGIYDGSWKALMATYNAAGAGSGAVPGLDAAQAANFGMRNTGLYKSLCVYYLTSAEVTLLKNAGITMVYMHNPSTAQAYGESRGGFCTAVNENYNGTGIACSQDGLQIHGGGPGFRPDMSAFYPVYITNGLPVACIIPTSSIYHDLGYDMALTNSSPTEAYARSMVEATVVTKGGKTTITPKMKLIAFGIGNNAECVINQMGLGEAPYNPVYTKRDYRSYIAVFAIKPGGQGVASTCRLAGIVDCAGNTYRSASYNADWQTELDN